MMVQLFSYVQKHGKVDCSFVVKLRAKQKVSPLQPAMILSIAF